MIDRSIVEKFLAANGVDTNSPDEHIKSVLISAKWHEDDVETALMVLREDAKTHKTRVDSLHKVFRSDDKLQPETISSLLGIDVDIPADTKQVKRAKNNLQFTDVIKIVVASVVLCIGFFVFIAWQLQLGPFMASL